jgi:glycosyltransferase involved in cell wall biosynthesis
MRILRVAQKAYPDVKGGGPYHVHAMSRDQAAMGHHVTVLTLGEHGTEERAGYRVVRRSSTATALGNDISAGVARYLHRHADAFDVVHAHSHLYFSTNLAAVARRLGGPPLAVTNHGLYSQTVPEAVFDAYLRTVGRWTFDRGDVVFCYTDEDRDRLREFGVSASVEVVPNGIDTSRFTPEGPTSDRVPEGGPVVLFVGRLVAGKEPRDAVAAFDRLRETHPDARLVVCGDGPLRDPVEREITERGLAGAVTLLGHVPYDEMPAVYRAADALVLPSRAEGLPRTVLEALAAGVPVVVSDLEQVAPVVAGLGRTVPVGDVTGFAEALRAVLDGTERDPREAVVDDHDWTSTVEQTTATLERIVDRNG